MWKLNSCSSLTPLLFFPPTADPYAQDSEIYIVFKNQPHEHILTKYVAQKLHCCPSASVYTQKGSIFHISDTVINIKSTIRYPALQMSGIPCRIFLSAVELVSIHFSAAQHITQIWTESQDI